MAPCASMVHPNADRWLDMGTICTFTKLFSWASRRMESCRGLRRPRRGHRAASVTGPRWTFGGDDDIVIMMIRMTMDDIDDDRHLVARRIALAAGGRRIDVDPCRMGGFKHIEAFLAPTTPVVVGELIQHWMCVLSGVCYSCSRSKAHERVCVFFTIHSATYYALLIIFYKARARDSRVM